MGGGGGEPKSDYVIYGWPLTETWYKTWLKKNPVNANLYSQQQGMVLWDVLRCSCERHSTLKQLWATNLWATNVWATNLRVTNLWVTNLSRARWWGLLLWELRTAAAIVSPLALFSSTDPKFSKKIVIQLYLSPPDTSTDKYALHLLTRLLLHSTDPLSPTPAVKISD